MGILGIIAGLVIIILLFKISFLSIVGVFFVVMTICCALTTINYFIEKEFLRGIIWAIPSTLFLILLIDAIF